MFRKVVNRLGMGAVLDLKGDYPEARKHISRAIEVASTPDAKERAWRTMAVSFVFECNTGEAGKLEQQVSGTVVTNYQDRFGSACKMKS